MRRRVGIAVIGRTPLGGGSSSRRHWREAIRDAALSIAPDPRVLPVGASLTVEVMFRISEPRFASSDLDNLVKPVIDTLFRSRDEQLDPSLTAALLPVDDAAIHRFVVEKHRADGTEGEGVSVSVSCEDDLTDPGAPPDP